MAVVSIEELRSDAARMTAWRQHRFAQVDLSRPGYQSIQREASRDTTDDSFASTGKLDKDAVDSFDKMYANHARQVVGVDSFDLGAIDPNTLLPGINSGQAQ